MSIDSLIPNHSIGRSFRMSEYNQDKQLDQEIHEKMPSKGLYTFWLVIGFITGVLWGCLSISPYSKMNRAIKDNDPYEAWSCAKKVRMFALIGIAVNVVMILFRFAANS